MNEQERQAFLAGTHVGVLSVASGGDHPPLTVPVWYAYAPGGDLTLFTGTMGRKARKTTPIEGAGAISFCVQQEAQPYKYVTIEGRVAAIAQPPSADQMLTIARRYLPEDAAQGFVAAALAADNGTLTHFTIHPDRWLAADFSDAGS